MALFLRRFFALSLLLALTTGALDWDEIGYRPGHDRRHKPRLPTGIDWIADNSEPSTDQAAGAGGTAEILYSPTTSTDSGEANIIYASPGQEEVANANQNGYRINFRNVPIIQYLRWVSQISGTNFLYNESELNFAVTIVSEEPTSIDNIMAALLQILRVHGLFMAEQGNNVIIYKDASLSKIAEVVSPNTTQTTLPPIITCVFKIHNGNPASLDAIITPLLSSAALVEVSAETGHLIVTDIKANIEKVGELIEALDNPKTPLEIAVYHVRYSNTSLLAPLTKEIISPIAAGQPFTIVPQATASAIYIISTPFLIEQAVSILQALDAPQAAEIEKKIAPAISHIPQPGGAQQLPPSSHNTEGTNFEIYKLQYHDGSEMMLALREIAASMVEGGLENSSLVQAIRTIQWVQSNNSLVITGTESSIAQVSELLDQIDVPLKQVLIEMLVLKTDINNALSFGVTWAAVGQAGAGFSGAVASTPATSSGSDFTLPNVRPNFPAGALPLLPGLAMDAIGSVIKKNSTHFFSIQALIDALQQDQNTELITNQKLLVQDSKTAAVFVGQQIAFSEGTIGFGAGTGFATTSYDYRDIGTSMQITPYIGNGSIITLEIAQEVSETLTPITGNSSQTGNNTQIATIDRTTTTTRVHIPDRHFLIIAGQIRGENTSIKSGLPCLGGLPIIGGVFSSNSDVVTKNNLIIFIRPTVVASVLDMLEMNRRQVKQFERWNDPVPLELNLREWLNLPDACRPVNEPCPCEVGPNCCCPRAPTP